jgi:hypothetical protein
VSTWSYQDWVQTALAILALIVAPPSLSAIYRFLFHRIRVRCLPLYKEHEQVPRAWRLQISNASRSFGGFNLYIFPTNAAHRVRQFRVISHATGGLQAEARLEEGTLSITFQKFSRVRVYEVIVWFDNPDIPTLDSDKHTTNKTIIFQHGETRIPEVVFLSRTYQRMAMIGLTFAGMDAVIITKMIYALFTRT